MTAQATPIKTDEQILSAALEAHREVTHFETPHGMVIFKRPKLADYERFTDKIAGDAPTSAAMRELAYASLVHPDIAGLKAIIEVMPALPLKAGKMIQRMCGMQVEGEIKKA